MPGEGTPPDLLLLILLYFQFLLLSELFFFGLIFLFALLLLIVIVKPFFLHLLNRSIDHEPNHLQFVALDENLVDQLSDVVHLHILNPFHGLQHILDLLILFRIWIHVIQSQSHGL